MVQTAAGRRVDIAVDKLPEEVVCEPPHAELRRRLNEQPRPGRLGERCQHRRHRLLGNPGEDRRTQFGSEHGADPEQLDAPVA
jgi:hypothetical protein